MISNLEMSIELMAWGLGGYIEGMERGGVANRLNQMLMNPEEKFFSTLNLAFEKINDYRPLDAILEI